jgi:hypothetical protein
VHKGNLKNPLAYTAKDGQIRIDPILPTGYGVAPNSISTENEGNKISGDYDKTCPM